MDEISYYLGLFSDKWLWINAILNFSIYGTYRLAKAIYTRKIAGEFKKSIKVINKEKEQRFYKAKRILKYTLYLALCIPWIILNNHLWSSIPFCIGIGLAIVSVIRDKKIEIAHEYENGIEYRGRFHRWSKIKDIGIYGNFEEMRIREMDIMRVKEV